LEAAEVTAEIKSQWQKFGTEESWWMRTAVVMPDHLHLLVRLGHNVTLAEGMRLLKGRMPPTLRKAGLRWQDGYYEHRLRDKEDYLPIFLYIYLNPYRPGIVARDQIWPGYYCSAEDWAWFGALTDSDGPLPEWLE
jgi:putative transposase